MAIILGERPRFEVSYELLYWTDIATGNHGHESRRSKTGPYFDILVTHTYNLDQFMGVEERKNLRHFVHEEYIVPFFIEEVWFFLENPLEQDDTDCIDTDVTEANRVVEVNDKVFINGFYRTVTAIDDTRIMIDEPIPARDVTNFWIAPAIRIQRTEPGQASVAANAIQRNFITLTGKSKEYVRQFRDATPIKLLDYVPFFDKIPYSTNDQNYEYNQNGRVNDADDGGNFEVIVKQDKSNIRSIFNHYARSEDEWRLLKGFLNHAEGRNNQFLMPWRTNDLEFISFGNTRDNITVRDDGRFAGFWVPGQRLEIRFPNKTIFNVKTEAIRQLAVGGEVYALNIDLNENLIGIEDPISISFVDVCRLDADRVIIRYNNGIRYMDVAITSIIEDEIPFEPSPTDRGYSTGFNMGWNA